jgi:hypothetical protein
MGTTPDPALVQGLGSKIVSLVPLMQKNSWRSRSSSQGDLFLKPIRGMGERCGEMWRTLAEPHAISCLAPETQLPAFWVRGD